MLGREKIRYKYGSNKVKYAACYRILTFACHVFYRIFSRPNVSANLGKEKMKKKTMWGVADPYGCFNVHTCLYTICVLHENLYIVAVQP